MSTQLEYERKREEQLHNNVVKFERMVQDIEDQLEAAKSTEQSQMQHIDTGVNLVLTSFISFSKSDE